MATGLSRKNLQSMSYRGQSYIESATTLPDRDHDLRIYTTISRKFLWNNEL